MSVYIILFRGVGGATQLPVAPLRAALTAAGFTNVATYINSGNAVVQSPLERERVISLIAGLCRAQFGFDKTIFAPTLAEWRGMIAHNPFPQHTEPGNLLHMALLDAIPTAEAVARLQALATGGDKFAIVGPAAYLHTPNGVSASKLGMRFDKGLGVPNTARNWNTVLKLEALASRVQRDGA